MPSYYIVLEKKIPNLDVYVNGNALSRDSDSLEKLAKKIGVPSLLSFFSVSPEEVNSLLGDDGETTKSLGIKAPAKKWFSAKEGLDTVRKLIDHLEKSEQAESKQAISNLKEFERVLESANQIGVRWHLAIDY
jgi:hypothetical protein